MKIKVTQKDIDQGIQKDINWCPIANAARRVVRGSLVTVYANEAQINFEWYRLPLEAQDFITAYDKGQQVTPIEFKVTKSH